MAAIDDMDWGKTLGSLANVGTGLYSIFGGGQGSIAGQTAMADPFATQRPQYQGMLQSLMTNPSSFNLSPAAQSSMALGSENLARQAAAKGYLGSGNMLAELQKFGQQTAAEDYYKQASLLSQLAGAGIGSPAAAAQLAQQGTDSAGNVLGKSIGGLASGLGGLSSLFSGIGGGLSDLFGASAPTSYDLGTLGSGLTDWWDTGTGTLDFANTDWLDTGYDLGSGLDQALSGGGDWAGSIQDLWSSF